MAKVLIVEDDRNVSRALGIRLASAGYEIAAAYDAATALGVARESHPDIVVLDITMPAGDGFLVAERMRQNPATCAMPIVFITASKQPGLRKRAAELGAVAFLEKPFPGHVLLEVIADGLGALPMAS